jgi:hypothetical protein
MSPTGPDTFTASPISHPAGNPVEPRPSGEHPSIQDGIDSQNPPATRPQPPRRGMTPAQGSPSRRPERHRYNDPCNYLG